MKIIPRTLGVAEIMSVPVHNDIITARVVEKMAHNGPEHEQFKPTCAIETCNTRSDFPLEYFCVAINTGDDHMQLVGLGYPTPDGAVPVISIYYIAKQPDYSQWERKRLEHMQLVVGEFNRIVRHIRALEKGPENGLPVQSE